MPTLEQIIALILNKRQDLTRENIESMIRDEVEKTNGMLTNESAAYMVASKLNVDLTEMPALEMEVKIKDLVPGINDVSVTGRVILSYPIQVFTRDDGSTSRVARANVADKTGMLKVVFWGEKADFVENTKLHQGQIVRVLHGYTREGLNGKPELHVGSRSDVTIDPPDVKLERFPAIEEFFKKINQLQEGDASANITAAVSQIFPPVTFERVKGPGRVMRIRLADDSGKITAVFWNDKVDLVEGVQKNDCLQVMGAKVKRGLKELELHVEGDAHVVVLPRRPVEMPAMSLAKIATLSGEMSDVNVLAKVVHVGAVRSFSKPDGRSGKVASLVIKDDTGTVELVLWNEKADSISSIKAGDVVLVESGYVKVSSMGVVSLNLGKIGNLVLNPDLAEAKELPPIGQVVPVGQLKEGNVEAIEGTITKMPEVREVLTASGESVRVASFTLSNGTGEVNVTVWRKFVDMVKGLGSGSKILLKNVYARKRLERLEVSSGRFTSIEVLESPPPSVVIEEEVTKKIGELKVGDSGTVYASIDAINVECNAYLACSKCLRKISQKEGKFVCERCGEADVPTKRIVVTVSFTDDTGSINAVFHGNQAEKLLGMSAEGAFDMISKREDFMGKIREMLSGRKVVANGKVVYDPFSGDLRYNVYKFQFREV